MPIKYKTKGDFKNSYNYLRTSIDISKLDINDIRKIADEAIIELSLNSPNSEIASSWSYGIIRDPKHFILYFNNSYVRNGVNMAIIANYGHGTLDGNWVPGTNYIDKPIRKAYYKIIDNTRKELSNL